MQEEWLMMMEIPENQVTAVVLGIMQDGGLPHAGCRCPRCAAAFADSKGAELALGAIDETNNPIIIPAMVVRTRVKYSRRNSRAPPGISKANQRTMVNAAAW